VGSVVIDCQASQVVAVCRATRNAGKRWDLKNGCFQVYKLTILRLGFIVIHTRFSVANNLLYDCSPIISN
jgi:hypothetical protein